MAKEVTGLLKLQIKGGEATPAPPVGPALGSKGLNIVEFCKQFNARTEEKKGQLLPVVISIFSDKSFEFVIKAPPVVSLIKNEINLKKGSAESNRDKVASISWEQIKTIAETKMGDLNAFKLKNAMKMVAGTARSMGVNVTGELNNIKF